MTDERHDSSSNISIHSGDSVIKIRNYQYIVRVYDIGKMTKNFAIYLTGIKYVYIHVICKECNKFHLL